MDLATVIGYVLAWGAVIHEHQRILPRTGGPHENGLQPFCTGFRHGNAQRLADVEGLRFLGRCGAGRRQRKEKECE